MMNNILSHKKLDIIIWYLYLRSGYLAKMEDSTFSPSDWTKHLVKQFTNIILLFMSDIDDFDNKKLSFYQELNEYISSNDNESFDEKYGVFNKPINSNAISPSKNVPIELDIAKAIYLRRNINIPSDGKNRIYSPNFGENELLSAGMSNIIVDELIRQYIYLDQSIYAAITGDGDADIMQKVCSELGQIGEIICKRTTPVTETGKRQWIRLQYAHESHWDERRMHVYMNHPYHGVRIPGSSVGVVFFKKKNEDYNIRDLKEKVRSSLNLSDQSTEVFPHVHVTDTHLEARWIANAILNQNSKQWMNKACDTYPKKFSILFPEYKKEMSIRNDESNFCLDTGAVMALHGIRDTRDIDYISIGNSEKPIVNDRIEKHNIQYEGYSKSVREIIENPKYHFHYKNIKSSTINEVLSFKSYRQQISKSSHSAKKDKDDILIINKYLHIHSNSEIPNNKKDIKRKKKRAKPLKPNVILRKILLVFFSFTISALKAFVFLLKKILPNKIRHKLSKIRTSSMQKWKLRLRRRIPNTLG